MKGWNALGGFSLKAADPAFLGDIPLNGNGYRLSPGTSDRPATNNLLNDLLADNGYQTVTNRVGGNISSGCKLVRKRTCINVKED